MLWVSFTQGSSFLVSSILFTGSRFGFLFPLCFLFRFSSPKLGDNSSFFESHLYPSNYLVLLSVLTFSKGFSPHCKFQRKLPSFKTCWTASISTMIANHQHICSLKEVYTPLGILQLTSKLAYPENNLPDLPYLQYQTMLLQSPISQVSLLNPECH